MHEGRMWLLALDDTAWEEKPYPTVKKKKVANYTDALL